MTVLTRPQRRLRRRRRVRAKVNGTQQRPRLSIFRSNRGISAQLINDAKGQTIAAASWTEPEIKSLSRKEQPQRIGELMAERAKEQGISEAVFDRGGYLYHGQVKAVAEGARNNGLKL